MSHLDIGVLHELLDGEISSAELGPITTHLAECAACCARLEEERQLVADTDGLVAEIVVPDDGQVAAPILGQQRRPSRWVPRLAWAATIVIAAGIGYSQRQAPLTMITHDTVFVQPKTVATEDRVVQPPAAASRSVAARPDTRVARKAASADLGVAKEATRDLVALPPPAAPPASAAAAIPPPPPPAAASAAGAPPPDVVQQISTRALGGQGRGGGRGAVQNSLVARDAVTRARSTLPIDTVTLPVAIQLLGGTIRLIEGVIPTRLEAQGSSVRVIYPSTFGDLVLKQQLVDGRVVIELSGPTGFPADSLARLRARIRE